MTDTATIRRGMSTARDETTAAAELWQALQQDDPALIAFFASPQYDRDKLAQAMHQHCPEVPMMGCTTAGEITTQGYREGSVSGFSLGKKDFHVAVNLFQDLNNFSVPASQAAVKALLRLLSQYNDIHAGNTFAFLLVDGSSIREENVISSIYGGLGDIPIFGGSAGDGLDFGPTYMYFNGACYPNSAVLAIIHTLRPFKVFKTQHFAESDRKMVVTEAIPEKRIVTEINGEPAGMEYAHVVGMEVDQLSPMIFAGHPVVLKVGGNYYVRSIQQVNADGSLTFYCAIDEGIVLTVAEGQDITRNLEEALSSVEVDIGKPELIIGCDCILRRLELIDKQLLDEVGNIMVQNNVIGFSTYGEQYQAMHINQTFTGVAIA